MSKNKQKPKWKVIKKEITDIVLANFAKFHLVLPDKMFQQVAKFSKSDDGVAFYVGEIITKGIQILQKITQINYDWKVFQHLKPEVDDKNGKNNEKVIMKKHNSKTKVRKHEEHHLLVQIPHTIFYEIKRQHARINTFSMALLSRIIVALFLDIYEKCGDYDAALTKMSEVINALFNNKDFEKCSASFKIFEEVDENDEENHRVVIFFVVNLKSAKLGIDFYYDLRL